MTDREKVIQFFGDFNPVPLSRNAQQPKHILHGYADYVELIALFSNGDFITIGNILDRFKDEEILKTSDSEKAEANDENERFVQQIFQLIEYRKQLYGNDYPFTYNDNKINLPNSLSRRKKVYLYLLLCSSLYSFRNISSILTTEFEQLCYEVLKKYLPRTATIKSFGENTEYTGNTEAKIKALAIDMKLPVEEEQVRENISNRNSKERGLDLVAWLEFDDDIPNILSLFFQCACGKDWFSKLNETRRYENYYKFYRLKPVHGMFIPYSLKRINSNRFEQEDNITNTLFFERKRILSLLNDVNFFDSFSSKEIVEKCIEFSEDIV